MNLELGAAVHFLSARLWVPLLQTVEGKISGHLVGGMQRVAVCHDWWEAFACMCKAAWEEDFLKGARTVAAVPGSTHHRGQAHYPRVDPDTMDRHVD